MPRLIALGGGSSLCTSVLYGNLVSMIEGYEVVTVRNIPAPLWVQVKMRAASLKMPIGAFVTYALQLTLGTLSEDHLRATADRIKRGFRDWNHGEEFDTADVYEILQQALRAPQASPTVPSASTDTPGEDR